LVLATGLSDATGASGVTGGLGEEVETSGCVGGKFVDPGGSGLGGQNLGTRTMVHNPIRIKQTTIAMTDVRSMLI
jgi:hypothetical protein